MCFLSSLPVIPESISVHSSDLIPRDVSTLVSPGSPSHPPSPHPIQLISPGPALPPNATSCPPLCDTVLDMFGKCFCKSQEGSHMPVLVPMRGRVFPACREASFRSMYIDDSVLASTIYLDRGCAHLLPTLGPFGKMASCNLGIPGAWFALEHRL